jgi:hypothetical protein
LKLFSDGGDSGSKKFKRGRWWGLEESAFGRVWSLESGVWSQAVGFVLVRLAGIWLVTVKMFSHLSYLKRDFINFVLSLRFAKIMLQ